MRKELATHDALDTLGGCTQIDMVARATLARLIMSGVVTLAYQSGIVVVKYPDRSTLYTLRAWAYCTQCGTVPITSIDAMQRC